MERKVAQRIGKEIVLNFEEPIRAAVETAIEKKVETGFWIETTKDGKTMRVNSIVEGGKDYVRFGGLGLNPANIQILENETLATSILRTSEELCKANPTFVGDFHVHLNKCPLNVQDMFQTMARRGLVTILANVLNRKRAKVSYYVWDLQSSYFNAFLIAAGGTIIQLYTPHFEGEARRIEFRADRVAEEILRSPAVCLKETFNLRLQVRHREVRM